MFVDNKINRFLSGTTRLSKLNVADFNDEEKLGKDKEIVDPLTKLAAIFEGLDFDGNRSECDDLVGHAYEYLMRHFATESGKSKGQFYTPAEVSRVTSMVIDLSKASYADQSIHGPTCGSGSLLLKAPDEAKGRAGLDLALYGQETLPASVSGTGAGGGESSRSVAVCGRRQSCDFRENGP